MILERFGTLFWLAVAILASRVFLELGRGLDTVLRGTAALLTTLPGRPQVIILSPTATPPDQLAPETPGPSSAAAVTPPPVPNLLETMTHDEMDRLLDKAV